MPFGLGALVAILLHKEQSGKVSQYAWVGPNQLATTSSALFLQTERLKTIV